MKKWIVIILLTLPFSGKAQLVQLNGQLGVSSLDGKIGQLTIFSLADSTLKKGTYIDSTFFSVQFDPAGHSEFYAKFKILGFQDTTINFSVSGSAVDLGIISLEKDMELEKIEVVYREPAFERTMDGIKVNVDGTTLQTLDNLFEILKASPKLTSPDDESIEIIGKGTPLILIDRQPIITVDELKAIPADMVDRIEIITNPSAKYRAQGRANGVIEVFTKNFRLQGYNVNVSASGGMNTQAKPTAQTGIGLSLKKNKFSLNANVNFNYSSSFGYGHFITTSQGDAVLKKDDSYTFDSWNIWQHGNLKAAYQFNEQHKISAGVRSGGSVNSYFALTEILYSENDLLQTTQTQEGGTDRTWLNNSAFLNYVWETDTNKSNLEININYQLKINEANNEFRNSYQDYFSSYSNEFDVKNESRNRPNVGEIRVTYEHVFDTTGWKISGGGAYNLVYNGMRFDQFNWVDEQWVTDPVYSNSYDYIEQIGNLFFEVTRNWKKFGVRAGISGEYTNLNGYSNSLDQQFMDSLYILPFPSASLQYKPTDKVGITLRYSSGIDRPSFSNYDPFVRIQDSLRIEYGNPYLRPAIEHNVGMDLDLFYAYGLSVDYRYVDGFTSQLAFIDTSFLMNSTPWNADNRQTLSVSLNLPIKLKWLTGWNSIWVNYNKYQFTDIFERGDFYNFTYGLWSYLTFQLKGNFSINNRLHIARWGSDGGVNRTVVNWAVRVNKKLLDNKLTIWMEAADILPVIYRSSRIASNYSESAESRSQFQTFKIGLFYKFGRLKQDANIKESESENSNRI